MGTDDLFKKRRAERQKRRIRAVWEVIIIIVAAMRHIFIQMESARIRMGLFRMEIRPARRRLRHRHSPQVIRIR